MAEEAIDEFWRFVPLTQAADHPLVPQAQIDAVWHLHLTLHHILRFCLGGRFD